MGTCLRASLRVSLGLCLAAALAVVVHGQTPTNIAGTWKLNVAKSTFSPGPAPKTMTITYTPIKNGVRIKVNLVPPEGAEQNWEMIPMYDGKDYPVTGNPDADTISYKRIDGQRGESTLKKQGKVVQNVTREVSKDRKTLTVTIKGVAQGKPRNDVLVFEK